MMLKCWVTRQTPGGNLWYHPGLEFSYVLPGAQTVYAQFDMVQASTFGGNDAAGSHWSDSTTIKKFSSRQG